MRKFLVISLLVCTAMAFVFASALAQGEDVLVRPYTWDPATVVYSDQNIVLTAGWSACRRGAVQDFLSATNIHWSLAGGAINLSGEDTKTYWDRPYTTPATDPFGVCMGARIKEAWSTQWRYPIGQLPAGVYTVDFFWWVDHPVTDVADYNGDGHPDLFDGTVSDVETYIQVMDR
jgi:hypothetical protein